MIPLVIQPACCNLVAQPVGKYISPKITIYSGSEDAAKPAHGFFSA
jgi:hypothetical protein